MTDNVPAELISESDIDNRVRELAEQISTDYADAGDIVLIGVLKGSFIFLADLSRRLTIPRTIEFIAVLQLRQRQYRQRAPFDWSWTCAATSKAAMC